MDNSIPAPVLILGIGNILMRDEGVGVRVIEALDPRQLPGNVEILDGGTAGADLLDHVAGRDMLIVVDAMQSGEPPGTVCRFTLEDLKENDAPAESSISLSLHQLGLVEALNMTRHLGCAPRDVVIFGIQPEEVCPGLELSDTIKAIIPGVIELVLVEMSRS